MKTVKLSYTILNAWATGKYEDAIGSYLGKEMPTTPYMELGKLKHEYWALYVMKHKRLPDELGGYELIDPIVEQKYEKLIPVSDDYQILLRGRIDLEDNNAVIDYKVGLTTPTSYVDSLQLDYYKLLRPKATMGQYICHDPYKCDAHCATAGQHDCVTRGIKFLTRKNAEKALEHIMTFGTEMIDYLEVNKLLVDYRR